MVTVCAQNRYKGVVLEIIGQIYICLLAILQSKNERNRLVRIAHYSAVQDGYMLWTDFYP